MKWTLVGLKNLTSRPVPLEEPVIKVRGLLYGVMWFVVWVDLDLNCSCYLNEEAGYKSAIAGPIFRDFAWHFKMESLGEKASLSLTL